MKKIAAQLFLIALLTISTGRAEEPVPSKPQITADQRSDFWKLVARIQAAKVDFEGSLTDQQKATRTQLDRFTAEMKIMERAVCKTVGAILTVDPKTYEPSCDAPTAKQ